MIPIWRWCAKSGAKSKTGWTLVTGAVRQCCFVDYWSGAGAFEQLREERQRVLAAQVSKVLLELIAVSNDACNAATYRRIEVPTCLVGGLWSPEPAQRLMSMFASMLPHASCFEVEAGHMAPITHPALVNPIFEDSFGRWTRANIARPFLKFPHALWRPSGSAS